MAMLVRMPALSPTMEEGILVKLSVAEGDEVEADDLLGEIETDKAIQDWAAFDEGTVLKILVTEGDKLRVGDPMMVLGERGEDIAEMLAELESGSASDEALATAPDLPSGTGVSATAPAAPAAPPPAPITNGGPPSSVAPRSASPSGVGSAVRAREPDSVQTVTRKETSAIQARQAQRASMSASSFAATGVGAAVVQVFDDAQESEEHPPPRIKASPLARAMAERAGLNLSSIRGTGPDGRVIRRDVEAAMAGGAARTAATDGPAPHTAVPEAPALEAPSAIAATEARPQATHLPSVPAAPVRMSAGRDQVVPHSLMRRTIARRLVDSKQNSPHFYLQMEIDMDAAARFREQINADLNAEGVKISFNDLIVKASAMALRDVPEVNASWTEDSIIYHGRVDVSVAVAIDGGLITPVVRNADSLSLSAISAAIRELATRARARRLSPDEYSDGTFSVSNLGMYGIERFTAIINPPESAILAVGAVRNVPTVREGELQVGRIMTVSMSCDHRVVDGATGARFLGAFKKRLEAPFRLVA
jgi:pyruvate dehydrogenase E2 component (dihydrolipoamide acetyltransferase)